MKEGSSALMSSEEAQSFVDAVSCALDLEVRNCNLCFTLILEARKEILRLRLPLSKHLNTLTGY